MSSIRKCFLHAKAVLEGKLEAPLNDVKDDIRIIENILKQSKGPCYFRCCNEMETRNGIVYMHCDSSPDMPLEDFKKYCVKCAKSIEKALPALKEKYENAKEN